MSEMIRLSLPQLPTDALEAAVSVLTSGDLVQGQYNERFEQALASYFDVKYALTCSSGTAALHLALLALDIGPGDEVVVPAFTFPATANVVELVGATPKLVDIGLDDFCIAAEKIEQALSPRTRAIMPVHEFGQPCNWDAVQKIADKYSIPLVEDAACAIGARVGGKPCGSLGTIGCFSLHPRKTLTTGEGGIVTTNDKTVAERVSTLRNHGMHITATGRDFVTPGYNYRLTDFQAALGLFQLPKLEEEIRRRHEIAQHYDETIAEISNLRAPSTFVERRLTYQTYHVLLESFNERESLKEYLLKKGIQAGLGAQAVHMQTYYRDRYNFSPDDFPCAKAAYEQGLALPMGSHLSDRDVQAISSALREYFQIGLPLRQSCAL